MDNPSGDAITHLRAAELFPRNRAAIHINQPTHNGNTPLHNHDFYEIALVKKGHAIHRDLHGLAPVKPNTLIVVQPGQWHAWESCRALQLTILTFAQSLVHHELAWALQGGHLGPLVAPQAGIRKLPLKQNSLPTYRAHANILLQHQQCKQVPDAQLIGNLICLLSEVARFLGDSDYTTKMNTIPDRLRVVLQAIENNLTYDWSLTELAQIGNIDASHLSRLMQKNLGTSPIAWLNRCRIERAAVFLLTRDDPVAQIGHLVGINDPNYFSRRFRATFNQSPTEYRKRLPIPAEARLAESWIQW